jgi:hypothetical protein
MRAPPWLLVLCVAVAVVATQGSGASHRYVPLGIGPPFSVMSSTANLGLQASYRHGDRGPLHTDLAVMPLIKTLRGV